MSHGPGALHLRDTGMSIVMFLALLVAGCQVPDLQPYAEATAQLRDTIRVAGDVTVARVKGDQSPFDPGHPPDPQDPAYGAWELQQLWQIRLTAANALVTYADALANITAAGRTRGDNARDVAAALREIGASLPGVNAPSQEVVALAATLGEVAGQVQAARDLAQAVERAEPAVEAMAAVLEQDLDDLLICYQTAYRKCVKDTYLRADSSASSEWLRLATYLTKLQARVEELRAALKENAFTNPAGRDLIRELQDAEQLLAAAQASSLPIREEYRALEHERERVETVFQQARNATAAWVRTHRDLAASIRANRRPDWREFLTVARELHVSAAALRADERPVSRTGPQ